jgi:hypothetical protein
LKNKARLEDITVRQEPLSSRQRRGGSKLAGGQEVCRKVHVGSRKKLSREEAMWEARRMKAEALGYGKDGV